MWRSQRSWNGVAILARGATPVITRRSVPGGNPQPGPKFAYKLAWDRLPAHARALLEAGVRAVLAGGYNLVPTEADIWPGHHEQANALLQPQARAAYRRLLD